MAAGGTARTAPYTVLPRPLRWAPLNAAAVVAAVGYGKPGTVKTDRQGKNMRRIITPVQLTVIFEQNDTQLQSCGMFRACPAKEHA